MTAYADSHEHLLDELARIDLKLLNHLEEWRGQRDPEEEATPGLYISDAEVDRLLRPDRRRSAAGNPGLRERIQAVDREIADRRARTAERGTRLRLTALAERFGLDERAVDALLLSVAPELDRKYEKVYAYLQDDITKKRPTAGLILRVLADDERERLRARSLFSRSSPLVENALVRLEGADDPLLSRVVTADQRVAEFLLGSDEVDPSIDGAVDAVRPETRVDQLPLDDRTRAQVDRLAPDTASGPVMRYVYGPYGAGKGDVVEAMCRGVESSLVRADAARLPSTDVPDPLDRLVREARIRGAAIHLRNVHELGEEGQGADRLARELDRFEGHVFLTGGEEWTLRNGVDRHEFATLHVPRPGFARRKELWDRRADALPDALDTADIAAKFRLTRGQIDDAIDTARAFENGEGLTETALYRGCRVQSRQTLGSLARKNETNYGWDDIVLPDDTIQQLREVAAHVKHQGTVYSDWGFEDRFSLGNGLNVLFSGPSGTGKTMAAEIIANDAGLDMFKIDLASVVSKYIGETEENLKQVFDEAEYTDAILFFDEADALFGERSEVSDSQDRYANVEVSYLLQRMEEHDGTVVLATNYKENIDDAFLRRINLNVEFPRPDRESRATIWRMIFPEETPVGNLDVHFLSSFEINGGNIKNVALTASFLAAEDDSDRVEMDHVVRALRRELQKTGRLVNPEEFGQYREQLQ
ncbi:AAA family ATPase [Halobacteriales archaeon QS_8_69_26]|nr:MAG: AAA family ATPase [Halobacteriales archaeon QS_8_69_26]